MSDRETILQEVQRLVHGDETILQEAQRLVHGDRQQAYGHPIDDFRRTAIMWDGLFRDKLQPGARFGPADVAMAMICVKLSREQHVPKRDNRVDIAGYAETLDMVRDREASDGRT